MVVEDIATKLALPIIGLELGSIKFSQTLSKTQFDNFQPTLASTVLEVLDKHNVKLYEEIKRNCINYLELQTFLKDIRLSDYLSLHSVKV